MTDAGAAGSVSRKLGQAGFKRDTYLEGPISGGYAVRVGLTCAVVVVWRDTEGVSVDAPELDAMAEALRERGLSVYRGARCLRVDVK